MLVNCPKCNGLIDMVAINCGICVHGVFKHNNEQVHPHSSLHTRAQWLREESIYGCGCMFKYIADSNKVIEFEEEQFKI